MALPEGKLMMKIKDFLLSLIFTKRCRFCRRVCDIRVDICENCINSIDTIEDVICTKCGLGKDFCNCNGKTRFYSSVCAPFYYSGAPKKAVIALKYEDNPRLINGLAHDMADCFHKHYENYDFDCIAYVPIYKKDRKRRGFNQAQLLAEALSDILQIPAYNLLDKIFDTPPQHTLPEMKRSGNLLGAIDFNENCGVDIENMRILLCDDIKTTGSTLDECAKTLLINGCAEVRCLTVCITKQQEKNS